MRKLIPLKSLYTFVAVAETGSMTEAAQVLSVSHSAVSQAIKSLESQLNQPLFNRVGRTVTLNNAGQKYYRKVAPALEQIVDATESMLVTHNTNRLTLNMINSLALHWWIPRVPTFQAFAPNVDIRISTLTGAFSLEAEGVDVALIHGVEQEWQSYYCEKLADDELVLVCHPELVAAQPTSATALLQRYPAIVAANPRRQSDWAIWCQANQLPLPPQQKNLTFSTSAQAVQATMRKLGVFVTHRQFVREEIELGLLIEIGHSTLHPEQGFYFACPKDKLKLESVLLLRKWLKQEFAHAE
ncbi:LysR substrate-binding domain-containing protein [Vibrio furnissii]|uniref:LysR family transcriptional regulator n=1 Tax=Vibrio furnissii TaxID=29494 RepID=A0A0Q2V314_VIBFU|nr:LysR substrate-binding domain-containing protein [Vibrio furnissii]KQH87184.1 LysR family transcriptional regulator [Vibrio furnissii]MCG6230973.1 LysR substrate-binding domain-containing protein [Vibrio furnissii]